MSETDVVPGLVAPPDLERVALGDFNAIRDAIQNLHQGLNNEIVARAQIVEPLLAAQVTALVASRGLRGDAPALGPGDAGRYYFVTDFNHLCYWDGSVWSFAPGDPGNQWFGLFVTPPIEPGWALCDGSLTTFLKMGLPSIDLDTFTTPDINSGIEQPFVQLTAFYISPRTDIGPGDGGFMLPRIGLQPFFRR